jgi:hypothetical protein
LVKIELEMSLILGSEIRIRTSLLSFFKTKIEIFEFFYKKGLGLGANQ